MLPADLCGGIAILPLTRSLGRHLVLSTPGLRTWKRLLPASPPPAQPRFGPRSGASVTTAADKWERGGVEAARHRQMQMQTNSRPSLFINSRTVARVPPFATTGRFAATSADLHTPLLSPPVSPGPAMVGAFHLESGVLSPGRIGSQPGCEGSLIWMQSRPLLRPWTAVRRWVNHGEGNGLRHWQMLNRASRPQTLASRVKKSRGNDTLVLTSRSTRIASRHFHHRKSGW